MNYQHFYFAPEYQPKVGEKVRICSHVPLYAGWIGTVVSLEYGIHVEFRDGSSCVFDSDDVEKHKEKDEMQWA